MPLEIPDLHRTVTDRSRHIEIQVLADNFGRTIHLEKESVQRRHQKVFEDLQVALDLS